MIQSFEQAANGNAETRRANALAIAALCVGGMVLSRSIDDRKLDDELRGAARRLPSASASGEYARYCGQADSQRASIFSCESTIGMPAIAALLCTVAV